MRFVLYSCKEKKTKENMESKNIHTGHRARLRQQMSNADMCKMPEYTILEYMLSFAQPYKDVNPLSHRLIDRFGSLSGVMDAGIDELMMVSGVSDVTAHYIKFCAGLPKIIATSRSKTDIYSVKSLDDTIQFLNKHIEIGSKEEFYYITMDSKYNATKFESLGYGSAYEACVDIRELVRKLSEPKTNGVIICHTHPFGDSTPSKNDIKFTTNLKGALSTINIQLFDHIIFSPKGNYSFFSSGLLDKL